MAKLLALADLAGKSKKDIISHIEQDYQTKFDKNKDILIAYESVGSWGCDSSSFFLLKDKKTNKLFEVNASHCSCYGFEDQWQPKETTKEALIFRIGDGVGKSCFYAGGYDEDDNINYQQVNEYIKALNINI